MTELSSPLSTIPEAKGGLMKKGKRKGSARKTKMLRKTKNQKILHPLIVDDGDAPLGFLWISVVCACWKKNHLEDLGSQGSSG
jgi:hypothetical protein